jgi:hypothetical protein
MFWSMAIYSGFQQTGDLTCDQERQGQTNDECARSKAAEQESAHSNRNEQRYPDRAVAERRHDQVKRRTRPLLIDEMKDGLIHAKQTEPRLKL